MERLWPQVAGHSYCQTPLTTLPPLVPRGLLLNIARPCCLRDQNRKLPSRIGFSGACFLLALCVASSLVPSFFCDLILALHLLLPPRLPSRHPVYLAHYSHSLHSLCHGWLEHSRSPTDGRPKNTFSGAKREQGLTRFELQQYSSTLPLLSPE